MFYKSGAAPTATTLLVIGVARRGFCLAGVYAQQMVGRAPADNTRGERYQAQKSPHGLGADNGQGEKNKTRDNPDASFYISNIFHHDQYLRFS